MRTLEIKKSQHEEARPSMKRKQVTIDGNDRASDVSEAPRLRQGVISNRDHENTPVVRNRKPLAVGGIPATLCRAKVKRQRAESFGVRT